MKKFKFCVFGMVLLLSLIGCLSNFPGLASPPRSNKLLKNHEEGNTLLYVFTDVFSEAFIITDPNDIEIIKDWDYSKHESFQNLNRSINNITPIGVPKQGVAVFSLPRQIEEFFIINFSTHLQNEGIVISDIRHGRPTTLYGSVRWSEPWIIPVDHSQNIQGYIVRMGVSEGFVIPVNEDEIMPLYSKSKVYAFPNFTGKKIQVGFLHDLPRAFRDMFH